MDMDTNMDKHPIATTEGNLKQPLGGMIIGKKETTPTYPPSPSQLIFSIQLYHTTTIRNISKTMQFSPPWKIKLNLGNDTYPHFLT